MLNFSLFSLDHFPTLVPMCLLISYMVWNYLGIVSQLLLNKEVSDSVEQWTESLGRDGRPGHAEAWYPRTILWCQRLGWRRALGLKGWQLLAADDLWGWGGEAAGSEAGGVKHGWKNILELPPAMLAWCLKTITHECIRIHQDRGNMRQYSMDRL